ncbi:sterol 3-beta-glucosyltransferase [Fusarium beomiforme]|uniref:Sterol 3-beta-glucosyltransferase n=1 Tax=Fusarium beomiforme TaxID=44412 RepID=A0A9P5DUX3_9HYPO|nr:sterol 3-beta-glucosyltransferase [Fusarium beomiforme]
MAGIVDEKAAAGRQRQPRDGHNTGAVASDDLQLPDINVSEGDAAPPPYGENHDQVHFSQPGFDAGAEITGDGRVNININAKNRRLTDLLAPTLRSQLAPEPEQPDLPPAYIPPSLGGLPGQTPPPKLNVVVQIVGSRGDVQPFVALGKVLKDTYGHRVRIATHPTFQSFVEENGLEFFSIGGDPAELMAFMVKHPGLMPGFDAITSGEVSKRRKGIQEILMGCWRSCIEGGNGLGPPPTPHAPNAPLDVSLGVPGQEPFVADAIIANPPSFAHVHIAEKLGIPLHMMFTMPWSPTRAFPHPLANIQSTNTDDVMTNYMSYTLVEMMTWQGLGDVINRFRDRALDLPPLSLLWAPGILARLKISWTYCWSPALIPKPNDWGRHIDIAGFFFLNLASSYNPDSDLEAFLRNGPPPVYIGFGSIVVDDPDAMTEMIFEAVRLSGVRALVSKGWGGLGADDLGKPDGVFMLGNVPHDWLFEHVSCVVHHGGAGTTAAGIKAGKPTIVVPFFGDQPFWGAMIAKANAGPDPIPYKQLTAEKLAEVINFCISPETLEHAKVLGQKIREERGTDIGGKSFHDHLDTDKLRCTLAPSRAAAWRVRRSQVRLSAFAAAVLVEHALLQWSDLKLYRTTEYNTEEQPTDPISACTVSLVTDIGGIGMAIADMPRELFRSISRKNSVQEEVKQDTATPPATGSETSPLVSQGNESDQKSTPGHSITETETLGSTVTTAHSNASQPTLSDTASSISHTRSPSQSSNQQTKEAAIKQRRPSPVNVVNAAVGTGKGVGRVVTTGVRTPMNFCLGLARGFRNMPRLYNDETIRPVEKVTGVGSGIMVAGKEFGYGLFDGVTGLVTQPLKGAEKEGVQGLVKGFGKGIGGLIAKPAAGIWAIPAYTMLGVNAQVSKFFARSVQNYIISSRATQGQLELQEATPGEKDDVVQRWNNIKFDLKNFYQWKRKEKVAGKRPEEPRLDISEAGFEQPRTGWRYTKNMSFEERKKLHADKEAWKAGFVDAPVPQATTNDGSSIQTSSSEDTELEKAIRASVLETSRGNSEEDAQVEAAIRESIKVVRQQVASNEAGPLPLKDPSIFEDADYQITDEEYQALIEQAIQQSLGNDMPLPQYPNVPELEAMDAAPQHHVEAASSEDDVELQRAIEASRNQPPPPLPPREGNDDEFERAIAASKQAMERENSERTEEDIVMEYVKRQSLAEAEYRKQMDQGKIAADGDDDDEELQRAMEESLKMTRGDASGPSRS